MDDRAIIRLFQFLLQVEDLGLVGLGLLNRHVQPLLHVRLLAFGFLFEALGRRDLDLQLVEAGLVALILLSQLLFKFLNVALELLHRVLLLDQEHLLLGLLALQFLFVLVEGGGLSLKCFQLSLVLFSELSLLKQSRLHA